MKTPGIDILAFVIATATLVAPTSVTRSDDPEYNRDIRPILADHCFACHGSDAASREADLRLDVREAAIEYEAIVPGDPASSAMISRILADDPDLIMPPPETRKPLSDQQKKLLENWVEAGAEYQSHWAFTVPKSPDLPAVEDESWVVSPIDRFVLSKLEKAGLHPASGADANTLFRRLHLDITGLPPSPADLDSFKSEFGNEGDVALSRWIDKLMSSSAWGEHRGRYWLDAARYADTHGMHFDNYREMWPYRDWVIRSFNANQPFDEFTIDQLAGDLRENPTQDQLIATGFQRCNITTNEGGTIDEENLAIYAADRIQTFGWVYLGLTTNCCQCHDHKFDPLTAKDYYSLAAYFRNTTQKAKDGNRKDGLGPVIKVISDQAKMRLSQIDKEKIQSMQRRDARKSSANADFEAWLADLDAHTESTVPSEVSESLVFNAPLNDAVGTSIQAFGVRQFSIETGRELDWSVKGVTGATIAISDRQTISVGDVGDFQRDESFSYGAWVFTEDVRRTSAVFARMNDGRKHRGWDLFQVNGEIAVHLVDTWPTNALKVVTTTGAVKSKQWQHIFATYDGSGKAEGIRIYVDHKLQKTRVETATLKPDADFHADTPFQLGTRSSGASFHGALQDVRLYSRELTADEIAEVAESFQVGELLKVAPQARTPAQVASIFAHYLHHVDAEYHAETDLIASLEAESTQIEETTPVTHVQMENPNSEAMAFVLMRGAYDKPGEKVSAAPPAALHDLPAAAPSNRMGLALWVADPANPLTARVTVNRFWQEVFGQGIVVTPEDFGVMGAPPTHPDLLDWLAVDFQENGWNVKRLFKQMLMSATYRQAAINTDEKYRLDRDNALLSRGPRFRMDAEMIRDSALSASGLLNQRMFGPGTRPYQPGNTWNVVGLPGGDTRNYVRDKGDELYRRTVYNFWKRMAPPPSLETLNAPSREVCTVRRERTNTPLQALVTLNDPQYVEAARVLAQNAIQHAGDFEGRVRFVSRRLLGRPMNGRETEILVASHTEYSDYYIAHEDDAKKLITVGDSATPAGIDPAELATWTMLCNQLLNLDEVLTK